MNLNGTVNRKHIKVEYLKGIEEYMENSPSIPSIQDVEFIANVQTIGRIAIPRNIRDMYGIKKGSKVKLRLIEVSNPSDTYLRT